VIFQLDVVHNLPTKLPHKSWIRNFNSCLPGGFKVIQAPQIGASSVFGLTPIYRTQFLLVQLLYYNHLVSKDNGTCKGNNYHSH
jgi:hypothetical protein